MCAADEAGISSMWFGQCDFIDGLMPDAIGDLHSSLGTVSLEACFSLVTLPDAFTRLKKLVSLDLSHCSRLAALPDAFGSLSSLIVHFLLPLSPMQSHTMPPLAHA